MPKAERAFGNQKSEEVKNRRPDGFFAEKRFLHKNCCGVMPESAVCLVKNWENSPVHGIGTGSVQWDFSGKLPGFV